MTILEAAQDYLKRGFIVVPLLPCTKKPFQDDWPQQRLTATDLPKHFKNGANLGLELGDDGVTDVDLDTPEAIFAGAVLLPEMKMIFGRPSAQRSHYFYRSNPAVCTKQFIDPLRDKDGEKPKLVELRGLKKDGAYGLQTMAPPSVHPDGETLRYEEGCGPMPANIDAAVLQPIVAQIAAAAALARHFSAPKAGRNTTFLALAGSAARSGWTPRTDAAIPSGDLQRVMERSGRLETSQRRSECDLPEIRLRRGRDRAHQPRGMRQRARLEVRIFMVGLERTPAGRNNRARYSPGRDFGTCRDFR